MRRVGTGLAAAALAAGLLTGCSGGDGSAFCDHIRDNVEDDAIQSLDPANPDDKEKVLDELRSLADEAPDELKDDYDTVVGAIEGDLSGDVQSAVDSIQTYTEDHCDVTYDGG
jgi:hypothetical protein